MKKIGWVMVAVTAFTLLADIASAGNKKQCAKSVGATAWYGTRSAAGYIGAGYQIYRGGNGNVGISSGGANWNKMKNSAKDVKKNCLTGRR